MVVVEAEDGDDGGEDENGACGAGEDGDKSPVKKVKAKKTKGKAASLWWRPGIFGWSWL